MPEAIETTRRGLVHVGSGVLAHALANAWQQAK
jgi:hypothetical protein